MRDSLLVMVYVLTAIWCLVQLCSIFLSSRCLIGCIFRSIGLIGGTQSPVVGSLPPAHTFFRQNKHCNHPCYRWLYTLHTFVPWYILAMYMPFLVQYGWSQLSLVAIKYWSHKCELIVVVCHLGGWCSVVYFLISIALPVFLAAGNGLLFQRWWFSYPWQSLYALCWKLSHSCLRNSLLDLWSMLRAVCHLWNSCSLQPSFCHHYLTKNWVIITISFGGVWFTKSSAIFLAVTWTAL